MSARFNIGLEITPWSLDDNKKAMEALIEARHALTEMAKSDEELKSDLRTHITSDKEEFGKVRGKLDILLERCDDVKKAVNS